jgi:ribosome-binding factor A
MTRGEQAPSQRQLRVAEQMRHLLAEYLIRGELRDPRLAGRHLTVAEVRVSRDLKTATVFATELGGELTHEVAEAMQQAASYLGGWLARQMHLKYAPRLRFVPDKTFAYAARIGQLLQDAKQPLPAGEDDADGAP